MWYLRGSSGVRVVFLIMTAFRETIKKKRFSCTVNSQPKRITATILDAIQIALPLKAGLVKTFRHSKARKGLQVTKLPKKPEPCSRWDLGVLLGFENSWRKRVLA